MLALLMLLPLADPEPKGKVELKLEFSHKKYDPLAPGKETIKGILVNNTGKAVKVPAWYDGRLLRLVVPARKAPGLRFDMTLFVRERREMKFEEVKAGGRRVLFELPLVDILPAKRLPKALHGWDWPARAMSPPSPAHDHKGTVVPGKIALKLTLDAVGLKAESPLAEVEIATKAK